MEKAFTVICRSWFEHIVNVTKIHMFCCHPATVCIGMIYKCEDLTNPIVP